MQLTIDLPDDLAEALAEEAALYKMSFSDYAALLLAGARPPVPASLRTGADVVAYWDAHGVIGSRSDITDPEAFSRQLRSEAERRTRE